MRAPVAPSGWPSATLPPFATAFAQDDVAAAKAQWRKVAAQRCATLPKLAALMDEVETDVLAGQCRKLRCSSRSSYTRPKGTIAFELRQSC
jgi:hypothetical protein